MAGKSGNRLKRFLIPVSGGLAGLVVLGALQISEHASAAPPKQPEGTDIAAGQRLYAEYCASCHGANLEGQENWQIANEDGIFPAPPHDRSGHTWHHGDALLFTYTKLGGKGAMAAQGLDFESGMPEFGETLSDQQIWEILAYIKSTWDDRVREMQAVRTEAEQLRGN